MSPAVTQKIVDIIYFLIPVLIILAAIIFWEKHFGKKKIDKETGADET